MSAPNLAAAKPTLLILDNIDSATQWAAFRDSPLLPTPPCHVLITTRADDIKDLPTVPVEKLEEPEALELLANYRASALDPQNAAAIRIIFRETECLAALVAAVGMALAEDETEDWTSYAKWLESATPEQLPDSGEWIDKHSAYHAEMPHKTPAILDDLRRRLHPAALRAIDYAALLPADKIGRGWLEALVQADADFTRGALALDLGHDTRGQPRSADWYVHRLRERDLLRVTSEDGNLLSLHRLHRKRAVDHMDASLDRKRALLLAIAEHAERRSSWLASAGDDYRERWIDVRNRWELEVLLALVVTNGALRFDHAHSAVVAGCVGSVLVALGRIAEAETIYRHVLEMRQRLFSDDHPDLAKSLNNLAVVIDDLGHVDEAEPIYRRALEMRRRLFHGDHSDVANSLNNLAFVLLRLGRVVEAEPICREALEMQQRLIQSDHPAVATILNNLACTLDALGRGAEAEPIFREALEMRRRLFQGDHPDLAMSLSNLAGFVHTRGDREEARPLIRDAAEMIARLFGPDHPLAKTILYWKKQICGD